MLSSSDAESVAIADLLALEPDAAERLLAQRLGYTESPGAPELREAIAAIYETIAPDDVVVVAAAEEGIFTAYHALLEPGDHVVVETPCYESALQVARSAGAEVTEWRRSAATAGRTTSTRSSGRLRPGHEARLRQHAAQPDRDADAARRARPRRRALCRARRVALLRRGLPRARARSRPTGCPRRATSTSGRSRSARCRRPTACPGLRLGWLASRDRDALQRIVDLKHYTTICSSAPSELLSALALRHRDVARRPQPRRSCSRTCRCSTGSSSVTRSCSRGCGRRRARSASRALDGVDDTSDFCAQLVAETGRAAASREPSTTSPATCGSASGARACPRRSRCSRTGSTHVLNPAAVAAATRAQGFRTSCRYT